MTTTIIPDHLRFSPDTAISHPEEDRLNRNDFIKTLVGQITSYDQTDCLVIGLHGPWGSGKSSALNLLTNALEKQTKVSLVVIPFNPWNFSSTDQLLPLFFRELGLTLSKNDPGTSTTDTAALLENWGEFLTACPDAQKREIRSEAAGRLPMSFPAENNRSSLKARLNERFEAYGRKIVVLIDDIDRLDSDSIRVILRLVRLNADFSNVIYVLAFDRLLVEKVLAVEQHIPGRDYLEKILQVSFDLPPPGQKQLSHILHEELNKLSLTVPPENWQNTRLNDFYRGGLKNFFKTLRDIKRYLNTISLTFPPIKDEINPVDFLVIEAIRAFYPDVHGSLRQKKDMLLQTGQYGGAKTKKEIDDVREELDQMFAQAFENEADLRKTCILLFPQLERIYVSASITVYSTLKIWRNQRRICDQEFFERYFLLRVPEDGLSEVTLHKVLNKAGDRNVFTRNLSALNKKGIATRFLQRMNDVIDVFSFSDFEAALGAILDAGDEIHSEERNLLELVDSDKLIFDIICNLLNRYTEPRNRRDILENLSKTGKSLYLPVYLIHYFELRLQKKDKFIVSLIKEDDLVHSKNILIERIKKEAADKTLIKTIHLDFILLKWRDWSNKDGPRHFAAQLVNREEGVIRLLKGFTHKILSHGEIRKEINKTTLWEFVEQANLEKKIQHLIQEKWSALSAADKAVIAIFQKSAEKPPIL